MTTLTTSPGRRGRGAAVILAAAMSTAGPATAAVHLVDASGAGDFLTIQPAIDFAAPNDTVRVAAGTWSGAGNRDLDPGGKSLRIESAAGPSVTTIDCGGSSTDLHRGFVFTSGEDSTTHVTGFTVTGGFALIGGAVLCQGASPTIEDCVLTGEGQAVGGGAGVSFGSPRFVDCEFANGEAALGGGLWAQNGSPTLVGCRFSGNHADETGGGMFFAGGGTATLEGVRFFGNSAGLHGGGLYGTGSPLVLDTVTFEGCNYAGISGGGLWIDVAATLTDCVFNCNISEDGGGMYAWGPSIELTDCTFRNNRAFWSGGGLYAEESPVQISGGAFEDNDAALGAGILATAAAATIDGVAFRRNEAIIEGGGIYCDDAPAVIQACTFEENRAIEGAGITAAFLEGPEIRFCSFFDNEAEDRGGAVYLDGTATLIDGATMSGNRAPTGSALAFDYGAAPTVVGGTIAHQEDGPAIDCRESSPLFTRTILAFGAVGGPVVSDPISTPAWTRCLVYGNAGGDDLIGTAIEILAANPAFCDGPGRDYGLHDDSSALPGGNPWSVTIGAHGPGGCGSATGVAATAGEPGDWLRLRGASPGRDRVGIECAVPAGGARVRIVIHDVRGRRVRTVVDRWVGGGTFLGEWDGRGAGGGRAASGVYFLSATRGDETQRRKLVRVR